MILQNNNNNNNNIFTSSRSIQNTYKWIVNGNKVMIRWLALDLVWRYVIRNVLFYFLDRCDKLIKVVIFKKSVLVIIIGMRFGHIFSAWSKTLHTLKGHWGIILNTSIMARRRPSCYVPMTQEARFTKNLSYVLLMREW